MPERPRHHPSSPLTAEEGELIWRLRSTLGRLEAALATISDALAISDGEGRVQWCNQAFEALLQRHRLMLLGHSILTLLPPDAEGRPLLEPGQIDPEGAAGGIQRAVLRHEPLLAVSIEWRPVLSEPGRPLVFCIRDISADLASEAMRREVDRIAAERQWFEAQALACPVTGLPNRRALEERLVAAFDGLRQQPGQLTVLFCDLNGFKQVNDAYGHATGDALLQLVGQRLQGCLRASDLVARLGGDEFVVLSQGPRSADEALDLGLRLLEGVCRPWIHEGRTLKPAMSVGIAVTEDTSLGAAELLRRADQAMYEAKGGGELPLALHDAGLERRRDSRERVGGLLRQALEAGSAPSHSLMLRSRPIQELGGSGAPGLELWPELQVPGEPPLAAAALLQLAERLGLGVSLGRWLQAGALEWLARQSEGGSSLVALRLSHAELDEAGLSHGLAKRLRALEGVDPARIALLLPDDLLRDPPCALGSELRALGQLGVRLVFDDFGAGSTPLQALARLPLTAVRLPPELCGGDDQGDAPLRHLGGAAIRLACDLGLEVIAQGIGSASQSQELQRLGCRWGQGPLFDPPLP